MTLAIERLAERHFPAVSALHRRVFRTHFSASDLRRKYATGHAGLENVGFVALEGARAMAFHGAIPQIFELDGRSVLIGQSCDSMADPAVQGRGLYGDLFLRTEALLVESGAALMYGFANQGSARALRKLGWNCLAQTMNRYSFPAATLPVARLCWKLPALRPLLAARLRRAFSRQAIPLDGFQNSLLGEGWLVHRYTPDLVRYKSWLPSLAVEQAGVRAWLKAAPDLMIGDLHAPDAAALGAAIEGLRAKARRLGIATIHCFACPGVRGDTLLGSLLPPREGTVVLCGTTGGVALAEKLRVNLADADSF